MGSEYSDSDLSLGLDLDSEYSDPESELKQSFSELLNEASPDQLPKLIFPNSSLFAAKCH